MVNGMHDDLMELNRAIAMRAGLTEDIADTYAGFLSICLGRLNLQTADLLELLRSKGGMANSLDIVYTNRDYLTFARMIAQGVVGAGQFAGLLVLGMNIDQARILARLSAAQITQIAKYADGLVYSCISSTKNIENFQSSSRQHFASALIAA